MRHRQLDRHGNVDDRFTIRLRLPNVEHRVANFERIIGLRAGETLGRILKSIRTIARQFLEQLSALDGNLFDLVLRLLKDLLALRNRRRVIDVDDRTFATVERLKRAANDVFARLRQYLHRHIGRDQIVFNEASEQLIFRFGRGGKSDLDLFEADFEEHFIKLYFLIDRHRND